MVYRTVLYVGVHRTGLPCSWLPSVLTLQRATDDGDINRHADSNGSAIICYAKEPPATSPQKPARYPEVQLITAGSDAKTGSSLLAGVAMIDSLPDVKRIDSPNL